MKSVLSEEKYGIASSNIIQSIRAGHLPLSGDVKLAALKSGGGALAGEILQKTKKEGTVDFQQLIEKRYSVRRYKPDPVEKEKLDQILNAARLAPTAANLQPFQLIVVETKGAAVTVADLEAIAMDHSDPCSN